ncbi:MAG: hypothetical protein P8Q32_01590 [Candidatus Thalassarchaeaceae archaeon]|jgi:hypothetical protein|nr:hypothetical protein [Candidatus Thalassarchaeaceae archaeon]|tara:strand:+ start:9125 stop:10048 length:924 start_codon:yes stop_codon:yes gene_type:complete
MREKSTFYISLFLFFMILTSPISIAEDKTDDWYVEGGNSILMEHYTATWCDVCAKIDPWISDFVDDRGSRMIRIALHDPVDDPLGDSITSERLSNFPNGQDLAPSFWFDSDNQIKGLVAPVDLDRALLNSESNRDSDTPISILVSKDETNNSLKLVVDFVSEDNISDSQASIFLLEDTSIEKSLATNGITWHEDVTKGYVNIDILENHSNGKILTDSNFNSGFSNISIIRTSDGYTVNLDYILSDEDINDISIVAAHEHTDDGQRSTLGAVSLLLGPPSNNDGISIFIPFISITIISALILFKGRFL